MVPPAMVGIEAVSPNTSQTQIGASGASSAPISAVSKVGKTINAAIESVMNKASASPSSAPSVPESHHRVPRQAKAAQLPSTALREGLSPIIIRASASAKTGSSADRWIPTACKVPQCSTKLLRQ